MWPRSSNSNQIYPLLKPLGTQKKKCKKQWFSDIGQQAVVDPREKEHKQDEPLIVLACYLEADSRPRSARRWNQTEPGVALHKEDRDQNFGRPQRRGCYTKAKDRALEICRRSP